MATTPQENKTGGDWISQRVKSMVEFTPFVVPPAAADG